MSSKIEIIHFDHNGSFSFFFWKQKSAFYFQVVDYDKNVYIENKKELYEDS